MVSMLTALLLLQAGNPFAAVVAKKHSTATKNKSMFAARGPPRLKSRTFFVEIELKAWVAA